ncbi:MAG: TonB family protein [Armatimonadota bacterium]|nr:TonB family protein [Armatimonadota bacterium]
MPPASRPPAGAPRAPTLTPPVPVDLAPPHYPGPSRMVVEAPGVVASARVEPADARVRLRLVVLADGTVGSVAVALSSGRADLDAAALRAARAWRFLPARRDGVPVDSVVLIWVLFTAAP